MSRLHCHNPVPQNQLELLDGWMPEKYITLQGGEIGLKKEKKKKEVAAQ